MNIAEFKRILTAFADSSGNFDLERGSFLVEIRGDVIEGTVGLREGSLVVQEKDAVMPAPLWIIRRVAKVQSLADRIIDPTLLPDDPNFVVPQGTLLNVLDDAPDESTLPVVNSVEALQTQLDRRLADATFLCYLTSDAGEGKTTVINHLARLQAQRYREKTTDWLLLPVPLAGRTLLRFDDVIIGTLVNRFRFQLWYYDALIELVRLGVIVLALDGFEEMFVESSTGEAVSALGNLVRLLESSGSVLIAARKAYFEYKSLETQARLYDAIDRGSVATARLALRRWGRPQFLEYTQKRGIANGEQIYEDVAGRLRADHPLLTRAVLAVRLVNVASTVGDRNALLGALAAAPQQFFSQFIHTIIDREIREKWIDRSGEPHRPLLSIDEHYNLLSLIAIEMWANRTGLLPEDLIDVVADLFSEANQKTPVVAKQIRERIKQHALIIRMGTGRMGAYAFDHEEFRGFFLGWGAAKAFSQKNWLDVKRVLEVDILPQQATDTAVHFIRESADQLAAPLEELVQLCSREPGTSLVRENIGSLVIRLLDQADGGGVVIRDLVFPADCLSGKRLRNVVFDRCRFQPTSVEGAFLDSCRFTHCTFDRLDLPSRPEIRNVRLETCVFKCVVQLDRDVPLYHPAAIEPVLRRLGIVLAQPESPATPSAEIEPNEDLATAQRMFRAFLRATAVNENVMRLKGGNRWEPVVARLIQGRVFMEVPYHGGGQQRRFKLIARMSDIESALKCCDRTLDGFIRCIDERRSRGGATGA